MKAKHIVLMIVVSAVTALTSVFLYAKIAGRNNQSVMNSQSQLPVNYAGLFDGGGQPSGPVDFESASATAIPAVVHIKTKTNPVQTNNQQRRRSPFSDLFGDDFFDDFFGGRYYVDVVVSLNNIGFCDINDQYTQQSAR